MKTRIDAILHGTFPSATGACGAAISILLLAISSPSLMARGPGQKPEARKPQVFPVNSHPHGKTYSQWAAAWWQWNLGLPATGHPGLDETGASAGVNQSGRVWFVAAPLATLERNYAVPQGTALFVALPVVECSSLEAPDSGFHGDTEADQRACAKFWADHIRDVFLEVDGVRLPHPETFRVSTAQFQFTAPTPWVYGPTGGEGTSVGDGYYVMLAPLSRGQHTLHYGGRFHFSVAEGDDFDLELASDVTDHVTVEEQKAEVAPPRSHPYGHSYSEWAAAWWQWAYSFPADANPVIDPDGSLSGLGDQGKVWFLAGNFGGTTVRQATVPAGKGLLFPLLNQNWVQFPTDPPIPPECAAQNYECLREIIRPATDGAALSCSIDGVPLGDLLGFREDSTVFEVTVPAGNVLGLAPGTYAPCVDNGYYLMVKPLPPGQHTIQFTGTSFNSSFSLNVTYHLTIEEREHP